MNSTVPVIKAKVKHHIDSGPCHIASKFVCPALLMVLSCVMMTNWFVLMFASKDCLEVTNLSVFGFGVRVAKVGQFFMAN